jgi:predicted alpha/beta-hydrolase family hydrolase
VARDRAGLREAVQGLRAQVSGRVFLGGQSYGGRQASILAAAEPGLADALLLLSYPLHPPGRGTELRTAHFPALRTPALFVHGAADPFGTLVELEAALKLIPARTSLLPIEGAGHDLYRRGGRVAVEAIVAAFLAFVSR